MYRGFVPETTKQLDSLYDSIFTMHRKNKVPQKEVADLLGVTRVAYNYKLNRRTLTLKDFVEIMDYFGKDINVSDKAQRRGQHQTQKDHKANDD